MASATKVIGISALTALGIWGVTKLVGKAMDLNTMLDTLDFELSITKFQFGYPNVTIKADVYIVNPSKFALSDIQKPYLDLYFTAPGSKDAVKIASSMISEETVSVQASTKSKLSDFTLTFDTVDFLTTMWSVVSILIEGVNWQARTGPEWLHNAAIINQNIDKVYPCFSVRVLSSYAGVDINKVFSLG